MLLPLSFFLGQTLTGVTDPSQHREGFPGVDHARILLYYNNSSPDHPFRSLSKPFRTLIWILRRSTFHSSRVELFYPSEDGKVGVNDLGFRLTVNGIQTHPGGVPKTNAQAALLHSDVLQQSPTLPTRRWSGLPEFCPYSLFPSSTLIPPPQPLRTDYLLLPSIRS